MKIILITHLFPDAGNPYNGIFNLSRVRALKKLGHQIKVIVPVSIIPPVSYFLPWIKIPLIREYYKNNGLKKSIDEYEECEINYVKWFPLPKKILWPQQIITFKIPLLKQLRKIAKEFSFDSVIISCLHPEGTFTKYIKNEFNVPVVVIAEGSEILVYPDLYKGIEKIISTVNKYADRLILVSDYMRTKVEKKYNLTASEVIKNGYDQNVFYYSPGIDKTNDIISVGSLEHVKGHDVLLEALKTLDGVKCLIVGDGPLYEHYSDFITQNGMADRVKIIKYLPPEDLKTKLDESRVFCLPSRSESFGIASIEAMACGLPVVSTETGEMQAVIKNGMNGYVLHKLSPESLRKYLNIGLTKSWEREIISLSVEKYGLNYWAETVSELIIKRIKIKSINA